MAEERDWRRYEKAAAQILDAIAGQFGLRRVEGKQSVPGTSGTTWEIDAKGVVADGHSFVIVECRRYPTSRLNQEELSGLAFRIIDTGAAGGIVVTPIGLQEGASKVAAAANVTVVRLNQDATPRQFAIEFLGNVIVHPVGLQIDYSIGSISIEVESNTPPS